MPVQYTNNQNRQVVNVLFPKDEAAFLLGRFRGLGNSYLEAKYMGAVLRKAMAPGRSALRKTTPKGPSGNLKRAISAKVVKYSKQTYGWAVALVGYRRAGSAIGNVYAFKPGRVQKGKDRAFHQGFLEFGTKRRETKNGSVASTWNTRGAFLIETKEVRRKNKATGKYEKHLKKMPYSQVGMMYTVPKSPKAFFKKAPNKEPVDLSYMEAQAPVKTAYNRALPTMRSIIADLAPKKLEKAYNELIYRPYNSKFGSRNSKAVP